MKKVMLEAFPLSESDTTVLHSRRRLPLSWLLATILCTIALFLDLHHLGESSIWFDEAFSVELARQPLAHLWSIIWGPEPNMELYYLLLHFWLAITALFGLHQTEFVVRLPSAVCAALSVPVVFLLGKRYIGLFPAVLATLLYLLTYWVLADAQQARSYAMQLLLLCLSWYMLLRACTDLHDNKRRWMGYVLTTILAIYAHLFSILVVAAQIVAVAGLYLLPGQWRHAVRRQGRAFVSSLLVIALLFLASGLGNMRGSKTGWLSVPHWQDLYNLLISISAGYTFYIHGILFCCIVGMLIILLSCCLANIPAIGRFVPEQTKFGKQARAILCCKVYLPTFWVLLCWLLLPIAISYVVSQGSLRLFSARYLVVIAPALCLCIGLGIASLRNHGLQVFLACELIALAFHVSQLYYREPQVEDWRTPTYWLQQHYHDGDGLVCFDNDEGCQISVEYYLHAYPISGARFTADSPGAFSWANYGPATSGQGARSAVDPHLLAMYGTKHPRLFFIIGRLPNASEADLATKAQQWLDSHYHFVDQIVRPAVTVRLYITESAEQQASSPSASRCA